MKVDSAGGEDSADEMEEPPKPAEEKSEEDLMTSMKAQLQNQVNQKKAFQSNFATVWKNKDGEEIETTVTRSQVPDNLMEF